MGYWRMTLCCMLLVGSGLANSAAAVTSQERIALSLSGPDCSSQRSSIGAGLAHSPGVSRVDLESVPDHALVDIAYGAVTAEELRAAATRRISSGIHCRVEIMTSCITASLSPAPQ